MITASSTILLGRQQRVVPGLLLARFDRFSENEIKNGFRMRTRIGTQLIVADLHNEVFPLDLKEIILDSGIYLSVTNFDLFLQSHGLFLTSNQRMLTRKYDDPPGIRLAGKCQRVFRPHDDIFSFSGVPTTIALN